MSQDYCLNMYVKNIGLQRTLLYKCVSLFEKYKISFLSSGNQGLYWNSEKDDMLLTDSLDKALDISVTQSYVALNFFQRDFDFIFSIFCKKEKWIYKMGFIIEDVHFFNINSQKNFQLILDITKELLNIFDLIYGFGNIGSYALPENNQWDVIKSIFHANFFGPQLVEKYGREKLLSAPSWKTEELSDGGIMLVRSPNPFTIDEPYIKAEEIEKHLGIR